MRKINSRPRRETLTDSDWFLDQFGPMYHTNVGDRSMITPEQLVIREAIDAMGAHPRKDPIGVKFKDVIEMRFYGMMTHQEIAEVMGWKDRRWTAVYLRRALNRLANELDLATS